MSKKQIDDGMKALEELYSRYKSAVPTKVENIRINNPFPSFDRYLGGGPAYGKITTYAGKFSVGKTSLALQMAGANPDAVIGFIDCEFEWTDESYKWVKDYFGIDRERIHVFQPEYIEEAANIVYDMCGVCDIIVYDGLTSIGSKVEFDDDVESNKIGQDARTINKFLRKFRGRVYKTDTCLMITNKIYDNVGNTYEPIVEPGGKGVGYYPSQKLWLTLGNEKEGKEVIGQAVNITVKKDKLSIGRGKRFTLYYYNGVGFDVLRDVIDNAIDFDIINKSGSWYSYKETKIGQGVNKVKQFLEDNPELLEEVRADLNKAIKEEIKNNTDE